MIPELSEPQLSRLKSRAEAKVYRSFRDNLPASYVVCLLYTSDAADE